MKTKHCFIVLFLRLAIMAFSEENEKTMSIQANPLIYTVDMAYLFMDNDIETFAISTDVEFQYAINKHLNVSISNTLFFENYLSGYLEDSGGRYDEDYGQQFRFLLMPAIMYRPFGTWLKGIYISLYPTIGWTYVSTKRLDDTFTHLGLGLLSGYQWILKNGFTIQLGGGLSKTWIIPFQNNKGKYRVEDEWHFFNLPFDFCFAFRLGYSFWINRK